MRNWHWPHSKEVSLRTHGRFAVRECSLCQLRPSRPLKLDAPYHLTRMPEVWRKTLQGVNRDSDATLYPKISEKNYMSDKLLSGRSMEARISDLYLEPKMKRLLYWAENHGRRIHAWGHSTCNLSALSSGARSSQRRTTVENVLCRRRISILFRMWQESSLRASQQISQKENLKLTAIRHKTHAREFP